MPRPRPQNGRPCPLVQSARGSIRGRRIVVSSPARYCLWKEAGISSQPQGTSIGVPAHVDVALRSIGQPNALAHQFDFWDASYEWRRVFSELFGTFLLVTVAVGGGMVNARFGGAAVPGPARVVGPGLMVMAIILFMGAVSGAHLNPGGQRGFRASR